MLIIFIFILCFLRPSEFTPQAWKTLLLFLLAFYLWTTELIPLPITGLLILGLIPTLKIASPSLTFSLFGNRFIFFILGTFIISAGIMKSRLSDYIAGKLMAAFGTHPRKIQLGVLVISALLSFFMPEHAVAAMLLPIALSIANRFRLMPGSSNFGKTLFISLAWGSIIGGIATFLGGARNPLAVGLLSQTFSKDISFLQWLIHSLPVVVLLLAGAQLLLVLFFPFKDERFENITFSLEVPERLSREGKITLAVFLITLFFWLILPPSYLASTAIMGGIALIILRIIRWEEVEDYINWGIIFMYGGAIVLGSLVEKTGVARWAVEKTLGLFHSPFQIVVFLSALTIIITQGVSNAAAVSIILPVAFGFSEVAGLDPELLTYVIALSGGLAFTYPIGSPPNAIAYSSGYYRVKDVILPGALLCLLGIGIISFFAVLY